MLQNRQITLQGNSQNAKGRVYNQNMSTNPCPFTALQRNLILIFFLPMAGYSCLSMETSVYPILKCILWVFSFFLLFFFNFTWYFKGDSVGYA